MCGDGFSKCRFCGRTSCCKRQHDLDQTGDPRCRFEVPDVGLRRSDQQRPVRVTADAVGGRGGLDLDRVAQRGAGAVRLEVIDIPTVDTGTSQRCGDKPLLCTAVGHRQTTGSAVLIDRAARDDRANRIAVALRIAEPLEHQNPASFTARIAVCGGVEGLASAVGGKHSGARGGNDGCRAHQDVHPTGQRHIAVTGVQGLAGLMDGHQRSAAGGVHRHRRSFQSEGERHPARDDVERIAGDEVGFDGLDRVGAQQLRILVGGHADEHAASAAAQRRRRIPGTFQALPRDFQHQPLLGIHPDGLARGNTEELRIESVDAVEVSAVAGVDLARRFGIRVVILVDVEAVVRDLPDRIDTAGQQVPVRLGIGRARKTAGHRDDRDRLIRARRHYRSRRGHGTGRCLCAAGAPMLRTSSSK